MGSGKSTVSGLLAGKYGMESMEMDEAIEEQEGMSIPEIFKTKGEAYFRKCETSLLMSLAERRHVVVSCGGGTPLQKCNVEAMRRSGRLIWLTARPETILERIRDDHSRPLLEGHKDTEYIAAMLKERSPKYEAAADLMIATDGLDAETICSTIIEKIKEMDGEKC
ncbi:MAG TPA: shikimate kinase [Lachnospiraceae bacterium]|nr:shikimate kinase [Lachnospiraceae bacterium]